MPSVVKIPKVKS